MKASKIYLILSVLSAVLLSIGFLFPHCGGFALFALVPLLWMDRLADREGKKHFFWWYYFTFVLWNAITTFWVCNATVGGGIFAVLTNALLTSIVWAVFRLFKKRFKGVLPYIFLVAVWVAWERFFFDAEVSWPWLVLGNSFAYSTTCVQWYEFTGLLGGSLWMWLCNLAIFGLLCSFEDGKWANFNKKAKIAAVSGTVLVFLGPLVTSWVMYASFEEKTDEGALPAVCLQPNFDPYEKFESLSQAEQNEVLLAQIDAAMAGKDSLQPLLLVAPETFTSDVFLDEISNGATVRTFKKKLAPYPNVNLLFGASTYEFIWQNKAPSLTARPFGPGGWYENHNSSLVTDGTLRLEIYHKSKLVVGTEKMPWPRVMSKVEKWLGGNVIGHCIGQDRLSLLHFRCNEKQVCDSSLFKVPFGGAVCYESVYPEYFGSFVREGARFMAVITNDAWWGNTPGYKQHLRYSCLRAIETRRDIVRCANTGISAFINQRGDLVSQSDWWQRQNLEGTVYLNTEKTAFVKYGDITGRLCTFVFLLMLFALCVNFVTRRKN